MTYDYGAERKQFIDRLNAWVKSPEGAVAKKRIDQAATLEEPEYSLAMDHAWDLAESDFEQLHPEFKMTYGKCPTAITAATGTEAA